MTTSTTSAREEAQPLMATTGDHKTSYNSHGQHNHEAHNHDWEALTPIDTDQKLQDAGQEPKDPDTRRLVTKEHLLLGIVAILYGTLNVSLRGIYSLPDPPSAAALSTVRGWLAALCFAPLLYLQNNKHENDTVGNQNQNQPSLYSMPSFWSKQMWVVASELALWNFGAQALVNVGLLYIESARAAFFTQLSVVMTPTLSAIFGHHVHCNVWIACAFALAGLILLSEKENTSGGGVNMSLGLGDILCLLGALCWSTYLFRLSAVGDRFNEVHLQAIKTFVLAIFYTIWCVIEWTISGQQPWLGYASLFAWVLLFYSALGPGTIADVLQQQGQAVVPATIANIILSAEPVFTAIFGRLLLGEMTTLLEKIGGCLILTAAIIATRE